MLIVKPIDPRPDIALSKGAEHANYLRRLIARNAEDHFGDAALTFDRDVPVADVMRRLRLAKLKTHMELAGDDLSGARDMLGVTAGLTDLADATLAAALEAALAKYSLVATGIFLVALGKMGAHELNYSSDIDFCCFYDPDVFDGGERSAGDAANRVTREMVRIMTEFTREGYVFRTDLRLRPDPGSTPLAVSTGMADVYYESVGQNWERMVWIKARACAGDRDAAAIFLKGMQPFVWRRNLDYWALNDIQAIKRMINTKIKAGEMRDVAPDVKLGSGGIREIEFFVQTQQLILGGRNPILRGRTTLGALDALVVEGVVEKAVSEDLRAAYFALRNVEHRLQMCDDAQTHKVPEDDAAREDVAALCGYANLTSFDRDLLDTRRIVQAAYQSLFSDADRQAAEGRVGNLVFTGVDDDPGTVETLTAQGFSNPSAAIQTIRNWHRGAVPATKTARGRELLTAILPQMLEAMGKTGEADEAFRWFTRFFEGLNSGVQTLSMLLAESELLDDLVATLALAPRLAEILARRPDLLEVLVSGRDPDKPTLVPGTPFDTAMDEWRRYHREMSFLIGHRLLHGQIDAQDVASHWSELANASIAQMAEAAANETVRRYGEAPGKYAVFALGKLGGMEMTAGSDLDIILIYAADDLEAQSWFTRLTQRLITALSAPTAEGALYEVDMRLRPSGGAGPVAVSIDAFERYHNEDSWTWEHMALTRLRTVCGDATLGARAVCIARDVIVKRAATSADGISIDVREMRERLYRDRPGKGLWDMKLAAGGLVDIEFLVQREQLLAVNLDGTEANTEAALQKLSERGHLDATAAGDLKRGLKFLQNLQQVQRLAVGVDFEHAQMPAGLKNRLCRAVGRQKFSQLEEEIKSIKTTNKNIVHHKLQISATEKEN